MAEQPVIDPRYDPAFQRGFTGAVASGGRADAVRRPAGALHRPAVASDPVPAREPERAAERREAPAVAEGVADRAEAAPAALVVAAPALRAPWTNPFAVAVAVLGVAVLATGIWLLQETYRMMQSEQGFQTQVDYWFLQSGMIAGPVFAGLGLAILVAVLMLCAVYWARRPQHEDAAPEEPDERFA